MENRILDLPPGYTASALQQAGNYLANYVVGRTLSEARKVLNERRAEQRAELDELTQKLVDAGIATLGEPGGSSAPTVIVRGRANLINDTMASDELARMRQLFDELESKDGLLELLGDANPLRLVAWLGHASRGDPSRSARQGPAARPSPDGYRGSA